MVPEASVLDLSIALQVDAVAVFGAPMGARAWELGKMGVRTAYRRRGAGTLLGQALMRKFEELVGQIQPSRCRGLKP